MNKILRKVCATLLWLFAGTAGAAGEINLTQILPLTGPIAVLGADSRAGAQALSLIHI